RHADPGLLFGDNRRQGRDEGKDRDHRSRRRDLHRQAPVGAAFRRAIIGDHMLTRTIGAVLLVVCAYGSLAAQAPQTASPPPAATPNDYGDGKNWLCRPGRQDACAVDLTTTVIK